MTRQKNPIESRNSLGSTANYHTLEGLRGLFRSARIEAGFDLETLAANSMVSVSSIRKLETTPQDVKLEDLYAVANALNVDPGVVLDLLHSVQR